MKEIHQIGTKNNIKQIKALHFKQLFNEIVI